MIKLHPDLPALPIQPTAWRWLQDYGVELVVRDRYSTRGGGAWWPGRKLVELLTVQEEGSDPRAGPRLVAGAPAGRNNRGRVDGRLREAERGEGSSLPPGDRTGQPLRIRTAKPTGREQPNRLVDGDVRGPRRRLGNLRRPGQRRNGRPRLLPPYVRRFYEGFFDEPQA